MWFQTMCDFTAEITSWLEWLLLLDKTVFCVGCDDKSEPLNAKAQSCNTITQHTSLCPTVSVIKWIGILTEEFWDAPQTARQTISYQVQSKDRFSKFYLKNTNGKTSEDLRIQIPTLIIWDGTTCMNAPLLGIWQWIIHFQKKAEAFVHWVTYCCQLIWLRHFIVLPMVLPTIVLRTNFIPDLEVCHPRYVVKDSKCNMCMYIKHN
jgi:hypothetical protein